MRTVKSIIRIIIRLLAKVDWFIPLAPAATSVGIFQHILVPVWVSIVLCSSGSLLANTSFWYSRFVAQGAGAYCNVCRVLEGLTQRKYCETRVTRMGGRTRQRPSMQHNTADTDGWDANNKIRCQNSIRAHWRAWRRAFHSFENIIISPPTL